MEEGSGRRADVEAILAWMLGFGWEPGHMEQVASLAVRIFDRLGNLHRLGPRWRVILEAAALVHDIGWTVSAAAHHKHASRIILERGLPGFCERERDLVALVVRYHRKAAPKKKHEGFSRLAAGEQDAVRKLAAMIRIADGLDRTHRRAVEDVDCRVEADGVLFRLRLSLPASEDIAAAVKKSKLFEEVFGRRVKFEAVTGSPGAKSG